MRLYIQNTIEMKYDHSVFFNDLQEHLYNCCKQEFMHEMYIIMSIYIYIYIYVYIKHMLGWKTIFSGLHVYLSMLLLP